MVINFASINSVVGMVPHQFPCLDGAHEDWHFVVEKPGMDIASLGGAWENSSAQDDDSDMIT